MAREGKAKTIGRGRGQPSLGGPAGRREPVRSSHCLSKQGPDIQQMKSSGLEFS